MVITDQPTYYVLFITTRYQSMAEVMEHAPEDIAAHIARAKQFQDQGLLFLAGAFRDHPDEPVSTMAVLTSREAAEDFMAGDPFLLKGMVSDWHIRAWANMLS